MMGNGRWMMEDGRWMMDDGRWKMEDEKPESRNLKLLNLKPETFELETK